MSGSTPTKSIMKNGLNLTPTTHNGLHKSKSEEKGTPTRGFVNSDFKVSAPSARIGIRRKRLKGDSWCYKKVCEQVLALTATELKQPSESSVWYYCNNNLFKYNLI